MHRIILRFQKFLKKKVHLHKINNQAHSLWQHATPAASAYHHCRLTQWCNKQHSLWVVVNSRQSNENKMDWCFSFAHQIFNAWVFSSILCTVCPVCALSTCVFVVLHCFCVNLLSFKSSNFYDGINPVKSQLVHETITFTVHLLIAVTVYLDSATSVSVTELDYATYREENNKHTVKIEFLEVLH